jgi:hypothetical protein
MCRTLIPSFTQYAIFCGPSWHVTTRHPQLSAVPHPSHELGPDMEKYNLYRAVEVNLV